MTAGKTRDVQRMFGRIVPRYDLLNRLISLGMDGRWRRGAASSVAPDGAVALDVGAGTGDLSRELARQGAIRVLSVDLSPEMLAAARAKATSGVGWALADVHRLPFPDGTFDCVTNAFVLRNLADLPAGLAEMARVLKPGGRLACLDMTQPPPGIFGALYRFYFFRLVPPIAGAISGEPGAYRYLPDSLTGYPDAASLAGLISDTGLIDVRVRTFGGGGVALHTARKR